VRWRAFRDEALLDIGLGESGVVALLRATVKSGESRFALVSRSSPLEDALDGRGARSKGDGVALEDPASRLMQVLRAPGPVRDAEGWLTFVEPLLADVGSLSLAPFVAPSRPVESSAPEGRVQRSDEPVERRVLHCRILAESRRDSRDAFVVVRSLVTGESFAGRSDGEMCTFQRIPVGEVEVTAGGGGFERATTLAAVASEPLAKNVVTLRLQRAPLIRVEFVDRLRFPLKDRIAVLIGSEGGGVLAAAVNFQRGERSLAGSDSRAARIVAARDSSTPGLPLAAEVGVSDRADRLFLLLDCDVRAPRGALHVGARVAGVRPERAPLARIWRVDTECGADMTTPRKREAGVAVTPFEFDELVAGEHLVEVAAPGVARRQELRFFLRDGQKLELDEIAFAPDARVRLVPIAVKAGRSAVARVLFRGPEFELLSPEFDTTQAQEFALFAGEHELVEANSLRPIVGFLANLGEELELLEDGVGERRPLVR